MAKRGSPYPNLLTQRIIYGVILVTTMVASAVAQPPVNAPGPGVAPLPPGLPPDFNPAREQARARWATGDPRDCLGSRLECRPTDRGE